MSAKNVFKLCVVETPLPRPTCISSWNKHRPKHRMYLNNRPICTSYDFHCYLTNSLYKSSFKFDGNLPTRNYSTYRTRPRPWIPINSSSHFGLKPSGNQESEPFIQELKAKHFRKFSSQIKNLITHYSGVEESLSRPRPNANNAGDCGDKKPDYLYFHPSCTPETFREINSSFQVIGDFVNKEEEDIMMKEVEPHLKRLHYEFDHWDDAIHGFREMERSRWGKAALPVISRMKKYAFPEEKGQIPQVHILDLAKTGVIKPHVDSIRFCGNIICGLCLLSDAVMRLVHFENKDQVIDIMLPRRALYIMKDDSRYKYTHEVLGEKESFFNTAPVPRDRRISIMCRNNPKEECIQ